jgi:hypothetical protein
MYRASINNEGGFIPLGVNGNSHQLRFRGIDEYVLESTNGGDAFICNVWCDRSSVDQVRIDYLMS